jgi:two-component system response regulator
MTPTESAITSGTHAGQPACHTVLVVDDNPADAELTREAFIGSALVAELHVAADGEEALAFLRREGAHARAPVPSLILLDLNMPRLDGRGVLATIKTDPVLADIPVVVFSSSGAHADVADAYRLRANCYVTKPTALENFRCAVRTIEQFWMGLATLPAALPARPPTPGAAR